MPGITDRSAVLRPLKVMNSSSAFGNGDGRRVLVDLNDEGSKDGAYILGERHVFFERAGT